MINSAAKFILCNTLIAGWGFLASGQPGSVPPEARESIEWCDIWISHANETNLPRVLLIGDSITRAYYPKVEKHLEGKAYVARFATSRFISDPVLLQEIAIVLDNTKFDIIHFNNGMHGWQHSENEYRAAFPQFLSAIKAHAPGAKLIWANTTALKVSKSDAQKQASDERIAARNAIALEFIKPVSIGLDDLNTLTLGHPEYHSDNVHFNQQGIDLQAAQVAALIEKLLKP
jgi:lysophospholipase L1-like esterase